MPDSADSASDGVATLPDHPIGTLAIVLVYAALFVVGWIALWLALFLGRGAPTL